MIVLIFTIPGDFHTVAVRWGLAKLGVEVEEFLTSDLPDRTSFTIDMMGENLSFVLGEKRLNPSDIGVFWNRRLEKPQAPKTVHEADHDVVERECFELANNARHLLSALVPTINPPAAQVRADRKVLQLYIARSIGMMVKPTLIGNSFDLIREIRASDALVHKPFNYYQWREDADLRGSFTALTPPMTEDLRGAVESCPMIFQTLVRGHRDVRVICFGEVQEACCFTKDGKSITGTIDGRQLLREGAISARSIVIPLDIQERLKSYMHLMNLSYAAFDFMVDEDDFWWFLECNESGQFLYIEYFLPETRLLEKFCHFLVETGGISKIEGPGFSRPEISIRSFEADGGLDKVTAHREAHKISKVNLLLSGAESKI